MVISYKIPYGIRGIQKDRLLKIKTGFLCRVKFSENPTTYKTITINTVDPGRSNRELTIRT
jgi:hypothetical protein